VLPITNEKRDKQIVEEILSELLWIGFISEGQRVGQCSDSWDQYGLELSPPAIMFSVVAYICTLPRVLRQYSQLFLSVCFPFIPKPLDSR
jgi:hypothetical protein